MYKIFYLFPSLDQLYLSWQDYKFQMCIFSDYANIAIRFFIDYLISSILEIFLVSMEVNSLQIL